MDRLDEWQVFVAVASRRSFSQAAQALSRSPQAVTRAVAALEARIGTRLLLRTTRSVSLTSDGERYLERARRALSEVALLEAKAGADAPLEGRLSITASVLLGQLHVLPIVVEFLAVHPALDVRLVLLDRVVSLAEEGLDLGVRIGALPDSALKARLVGKVRTVLCASPAYLAQAGVPRRPADLSRHRCIAFTATTPVAERWTFASPGTGPGARRRERTVTVRPRLLVNTGEAAIRAALAGLGVARVLSYQVAQRVAAKELRILLPRYAPAPVPVSFVQLPGAQSRAAAAFVSFALARLRRRLRGQG